MLNPHLVVHEGLEGAHTLVLDPPEDGVLALKVPNTARLEDVQQNIQAIVLTKLLHPATGRKAREPTVGYRDRYEAYNTAWAQSQNTKFGGIMNKSIDVS